jgi:hypothetical protein
VTIFRYTPPILNFRSDARADVGGVDPFGTTLFVNFESGTGKAVVLSGLLKEGALAKPKAVVEANSGGITVSFFAPV